MDKIKFDYPSDEAIEVFRLLKNNHNVIITGPPAVGKSYLMAEIRFFFNNFKVSTKFAPEGDNPFPVGSDVSDYMISPEKANRQIFSTTFHQNTKYRNFISGLSPAVSDQMKFEVETGPFYDAIIFAKDNNNVSLVEIDELNRGPAVAIFGDLITGIESDKRSLKDNSSGELTYYFRVLNKDGEIEEVFVPYHLFILASMNQADSAIDPLDVAFLRRFVTYRLKPNEDKLRDVLDIKDPDEELTVECHDSQTAIEGLIKCWSKLNSIIELTKGLDYEIGHGVILGSLDKNSKNLPLSEVKDLIKVIWNRFFAHLNEVFYGENETLASILNSNSSLSPFNLEERQFANNIYSKLRENEISTIKEYYDMFRAIVDIQYGEV